MMITMRTKSLRVALNYPTSTSPSRAAISCSRRRLPRRQSRRSDAEAAPNGRPLRFLPLPSWHAPSLVGRERQASLSHQHAGNQCHRWWAEHALIESHKRAKSRSGLIRLVRRPSRHYRAEFIQLRSGSSIGMSGPSFALTQVRVSPANGPLLIRRRFVLIVGNSRLSIQMSACLR